MPMTEKRLKEVWIPLVKAIVTNLEEKTGSLRGNHADWMLSAFQAMLKSR